MWSPGPEGPSPGPGSAGTSGPDFHPAGREEVNVVGPPSLWLSVTVAQPAAHRVLPTACAGVRAPAGPFCVFCRANRRRCVDGAWTELGRAQRDSSCRPGFRNTGDGAWQSLSESFSKPGCWRSPPKPTCLGAPTAFPTSNRGDVLEPAVSTQRGHAGAHRFIAHRRAQHPQMGFFSATADVDAETGG